jgi:cytochrome c oxidase assembly factor CtaG
MYLGAVLYLFRFIVYLLTWDSDSVRDDIAERNPDFSAGEVDNAVTATVVFTVVLAALGVAVWIWMAETNRRGRKWARIVATVLGGLNILLTLIVLSQLTAFDALVSVVSIALAATILWFLYRPESSQYYDAVAGTPRR